MLLHVTDGSKVTLLSCFHRLRSYSPVNMFLFKSLPPGLFRSEDANSNKFISRCYHAAGLGLRDTVKFPQGCRKTKQSKNKTMIANKHRIQNIPKRYKASYWAMVLKSLWKIPKLQAQTSQFEMTVYADERKFGGYVLIMNLPVNANFYPILYKPKYNPKFSFKS